MNTDRDNVENMLHEIGDVLTKVEGMLMNMKLDEQIMIEHASEIIYGPTEGNNYTKLITELNEAGDLILDHLQNNQ